MIIQYFQLAIYTIIIAIVVNLFRFKGNIQTNRWMMVIACFLFVEVEGLLFNYSNMGITVLVLIGISVVGFKLYGGLISSVFAWLLQYIHQGENELGMLFGFLLFSMGILLIVNYVVNNSGKSNRLLLTLIHNSKQLNVFKEVSFSLQQTLDLQKLLKTILTSVTAGYGLGFNRAMILLTNKDGTKLNGIMGTGPMTSKEGYETWEKITKEKYKLMDLIELKEAKETTDPQLNERVKALEIALNTHHFLYRALKEGQPLHIKVIDKRDEELYMFAKQFNMSELVVFPLIHQGEKVGVLIIDNPVNKRPITASDIDSVTPLANQAAIAILQSRLYLKIEDMAWKDGLTGLLNQRAFQSILDEKYPKADEEELSLILLDIDFFKHFNDTNGHLLGNEVLITLAKVIQTSIRESDYAFRFGGEEFVILLSNTKKQEAVLIAERLRKNVEGTSFPCGEYQPNGCLTISLGVASTKGFKQAHTSKHLVDEADKALYKAKEYGKNRVVS